MDSAALSRIEAKLDALLAVLGGAPKLTPHDEAVVDLLGDVLGAGAITTKEILVESRRDFGDRPQLLASLRVLDADLNPQRIGIALGNVAKSGGMGQRWRLWSANSESGRRVWAVGPARDSVPQSPPALLSHSATCADAQRITSTFSK